MIWTDELEVATIERKEAQEQRSKVGVQRSENDSGELSVSSRQREDEMSQQLDKLFDGETCLADDCAQRAAVEFLVVGNGSLRGWRLPN